MIIRASIIASTRYGFHVVLKLCHRLRRWPNFKSTSDLYMCRVVCDKINVVQCILGLQQNTVIP